MYNLVLPFFYTLFTRLSKLLFVIGEHSSVLQSTALHAHHQASGKENVSLPHSCAAISPCPCEKGMAFLYPLRRTGWGRCRRQLPIRSLPLGLDIQTQEQKALRGHHSMSQRKLLILSGWEGNTSFS